ncbi:hypothetical protein [Paenibacillus sp. sgz302251]|uniref:hypothetical protein n=1 Tax=Paenibacillus sp. sgz302251 TaxID=3414493 RepID=UPI003C7D43BB
MKKRTGKNQMIIRKMTNETMKFDKQEAKQSFRFSRLGSSIKHPAISRDRK